MCKAVELANVINNAIEEAKACKKQLEIKLKVYENLQQDILHKIENLDEVNIDGKLEIIESLHKIRVERRKIKNELQTSETLVENIGGFIINIKDIISVEDILKNNTNNKIYRPRIIEERNINIDYIDEVIKFIDESNYTRHSMKQSIRNGRINKPYQEVNIEGKKVYKLAIDKIPKEEGSTINVALINGYGEKINTRNIEQLIPCYESYEMHEDEGYIRLINRLTPSQRKNRQK